MNTKVKGDKIKDGSIPMSALAPEVKDKIENGGGGADWNAQEGEAGYIENKPFRIIQSNNGEIININSYFTMREDAYYPNSDLFIKYNNKIALLAKEKQELYYGDNATVEIGNIDFYITDIDSEIIINNSQNEEFALIIALSSEFIPDTVLKTTPQTLTNTDKNQALANLGIEKWLYNFKKKFIFNIDFSEITTDDTHKVTYYVEGIDTLIDRFKEFVAICTYYNEIGRINYFSNILTCTEINVEYDKAYNTIEDIKNSISFFTFSFGTLPSADYQFATTVQIRYTGDELFMTVYEL